jgi:SsrA-binding protein
MTLSKTKDNLRIVAKNRKARFQFAILDCFEAGIALRGAEVKSLRAGKVSIQESYATIDGGEIFLVNMDIAPYENRGFVQLERKRRRKLLLHRREIKRLTGKVQEKGLTLVPLRVYFLRGFAKVEIGLARGKSHHDKRHDIRKRDAKRDMDRAMSRRR